MRGWPAGCGDLSVMNISRYFRLAAVPFVLSLTDVFVTLYYQPEAYWAGDRGALIEANPIVWVALRLHPLLMIPGVLGWYGCVFLLMFKTPSRVGLRIYVLLVAGHLIGIGGWLIRNHEHGLALTIAIVLAGVAAAAISFAPFRSQWNGDRPLRLVRHQREL
ncbi:MAG: hypothetical protein ACI8XO_000148 [Verrucomicrobiales bacterium]|jgi:hypothetical protein